MKRIEGRAGVIRELLHGPQYTISLHQREYAWQERRVRELIDDLFTGLVPAIAKRP